MPRHPADYKPPEFGSFDIEQDQPIVPQLYAGVRRKILTMVLKPGDPVSETELAAAAGISRTPARQVIKQLVGENLLVTIASRGTYVSRIDTLRLRDALFIRQSLEPELAARCAIHPGRASIVARLRAILASHRAALAANEVHRAYGIDETFHKAICTLDGEGLVWQTIRQARTEADRLHVLSRDRENGLHVALRQHETIVDAIEAGDAQQARLDMRAHLGTNEAAFIAISREFPEFFSDASTAAGHETVEVSQSPANSEASASFG